MLSSCVHENLTSNPQRAQAQTYSGPVPTREHAKVVTRDRAVGGRSPQGEHLVPRLVGELLDIKVSWLGVSSGGADHTTEGEAP